MAFLVIFDLDGTLVECGDACANAWKVAFQKIGWNFPKKGLQMKGNTDIGIIKKVAPKNDFMRDQFPSLISKIRSLYISTLPIYLKPSKVRITPGAKTFLNFLRNKGHLLAIATGNFKESANFKLRISKLAKYFHEVVTVDDFSTRKEIVQNATKRLAQRIYKSNMNAEGVYMFGDSQQDIKAAHNCNIPLILITRELPIQKLYKQFFFSASDFTDSRLKTFFKLYS